MQSGHLAHVKDAFHRLGYEPAGPSDDDFTVLWAFHSPFHQRAGEPDVPAMLDALRPGQMVNQLPGAAAFASKQRLAAAAQQLPFLPPSFLLPEQLPELQVHSLPWFSVLPFVNRLACVTGGVSHDTITSIEAGTLTHQSPALSPLIAHDSMLQPLTCMCVQRHCLIMR